MQTDARLLGLGGVFHDNGCTKMFHCAIPASWSGHHICIYELLAIFIGLRVWGPILQDKRLLLQCDNSSSVILINTGRCHDNVMLGRNVLKAAFRPGTFKNLKTQLNTYFLFCEHFNRLAFPIDQETLCGYACLLAEHFKSSGSVRNYLSCIKTWTVLLNIFMSKNFIHQH
jgi:hypothetical protein